MANITPIHLIFIPLLWKLNVKYIYPDHGLPSCEKEHTADATSQQGVLIPPRQLIPHLSF